MTKKRILFGGYAPVHFLCFRSVYERLLQDPRIEVFLTGGFRKKDAESITFHLVGFYDPFGVDPSHVVPLEESGQQDFDVLICSHLSDAMFPRSYGKSVQLFHGVSFKNLAVRDKALRYDVLCLPGRYHAERSREGGLVSEGGTECLITGFPKTDPLASEGLDRDGSPGIIVQINLPPTIDLSMSRSGGIAPLIVNFDASGSLDPDGSAVTTSWQFGDGDTATGLTVAHTYSVAGTYFGTLSIVAGGSTPVTRSFKFSARSSVVSPSFIRADANGDNAVDISDAVWLLRYNFAGGNPPPCIKTADTNDDEGADLSDAVFLLNYLFRAGPRILIPFPDCGEDPTPNQLTCENPNCP